METLLLYLVKVIISSAIMFGYYHLFLRDKTFHHYNRFYLLSAVLFSLLLPFLKVNYFTIELNENFYLLMTKFQDLQTIKNTNDDYLYFAIPFTIVGLVAIVLLAKFSVGILKIEQFKKRFPKEKIEGIAFYQTDLEDAPFSYFRNLFWKNSILLQSDLGRQILKHEMVHIEQKHSLDKILMELITGVFWFNPIFWFMKREINLIHEYLADKKAVKQSDTKAFAQMLLASHFSGQVLPGTSPFLSSNLKKRLKMLQKPKTKYGYLRRTFALPLVFLIAFVYAVNAKNKDVEKQNAAIETIVKQLKQDTIKPNDVQKLLQSQQEKINKASEKLEKDHEKIATLSNESQKKSEELQKIAKEKGTDSYEYELKAEELDRLGDEIDRIANSDDYQNHWKEFEFNLDNMDKVFNSEEFKNQFKFDEDKLEEIKKNLNYPDLKNAVIKIRKLKSPKNFDKKVAPPISPVPPIPPMNMESFSWTERSNLSKEEIKKLEKLSKKQAELAKKQAELAKQQAEISKKYAKNNPWIIGLADDKIAGENFSNENTPYVMRFPNGNEFSMSNKNGEKEINIKSKGKININGSSISPNTKIYINGKLSNKEEMNKIEPENIATVNINKNINNGKEDSEIRIQTK